MRQTNQPVSAVLSGAGFASGRLNLLYFLMNISNFGIDTTILYVLK
jgi:hypothetical protein